MKIAVIAILLASASSALAQETNSYASCIAEASPVFGSTMTIENLRQYMKDHPTCAGAAGMPVEYPAEPAKSAQPCSASVLGFFGCKELQENIEKLTKTEQERSFARWATEPDNRTYVPQTQIVAQSSSECLYGRNTITGWCNQPPRSSYRYSYSYQWYSAPRRNCNPLSPRCNY